MLQKEFNLPETPAKPASLQEVIRQVLQRFGPRKQSVLASQLGASESHLSEVIKGHKHWPDKWLEYIAEHYDFECAIAAHLAHLRGCEVRPPKQRTAAERLRRLMYVIHKHNAIGRALLQEAEGLPDDVFSDEDEAEP